MDAQGNSRRQFWIFQANPEQYDALSELEVERRIDWYATRFFKQYQPGDVVYLWIAGEQAGIYAWAEVDAPGHVDDQGNLRLSITYRGILAQPLTRQRLMAMPREFAGLTILRNATGTNFRVTAPEAIEINRLIEDQGNTPPPPPDQLEDPNMPGSMYTSAAYVLDFRFDNETKGIIANCLAASSAINGTLFPKLLLQTLLLHYSRPSESEQPSPFSIALSDILQLEKTREIIDFAEQILAGSGAPFSPEITQGVMVKRTVFKMLTAARGLAIKTTRKEQIQARHLVGAILNGVTSSFQRYMQEQVLGYLSMDLNDVRQAYIQRMAQLFPDDSIEAWQVLINEEADSEAGMEHFTPLLTRIDSDSADRDMKDLLNVDDDAIALSKILCARDAAPPLAIGLFGEWGSGKTFFMRRIRSHVDKLTTRIDQGNTDSAKAYHSKVAQIWFNAWNYQDSDVWASLVNHVFAGLRQELKRLNKVGADEQFKNLINKLDEELEHEKDLQESAARIKELSDKKDEVSEQIKAIDKANRKMLQDDEFEAADLLSLGQLENYGELMDTYLGTINAKTILSDVGNRVQDACKIMDDLPAGFSDRARAWFDYIMASPVRLGLTTSIILIIFLMITSDLSGWQQSLGSALTVGLAALSARLSEFGKMLSVAGQVRDEIQRSKEQRQQLLRQKLDSNTKQLQQLNARLVNYDAEQKILTEKNRELSARYGNASDETFANFIYARSDSIDYTSQLGILNTVRRDFHRLNELLHDQKNRELPKLNRIILYIDDLDRCEPEVVVDVLQAIHLMLAFPLFMVVVGVDARWLGRSLKKRYTFLVHEQDDRNLHELDYHAASTHDYLEKIFQIPFWLRRLDGDRANNMIKGLLEQHKKKAENKDIDPEHDKPGNDHSNGQQDQQQLSDNDQELFEETEDMQVDYTETDDGDQLLISNLISTQALEMSQDELDFFQKLGPIVGRSPRAVKRFINLYRIVKASHRRARISGFSQGDGGFKSPLLLLAMICGIPKDTEIVFRLFSMANDDDRLAEVILDGESQYRLARKFAGISDDIEFGRLFDRLKAEGGSDYPASYVGLDDDTVKKRIRNTLADRIDDQSWCHLLATINNNGDIVGNLLMADIKQWIPDVARFSYREWVG